MTKHNQTININPLHQSDVEPLLLDDNSQINFACHKKVKCYNVCCQNADVNLTPYDVIRLKKRLNLTSEAFLAEWTVPYQMDGAGLTAVKLKTNENKHCLLLNEQGCSVYDDRPTACRYYPLAVMARKIKEDKKASFAYALIKEDHCLGHNENHQTSVKQYQVEQKTAEFDKHNQEWLEILLKRKSAGPAIGQVPDLTLQLFFMASFDLDRFRRFINAASFRKTYQLTDDYFQELQTDDLTLMYFAYRLMRQVFFADYSIALVEGSAEKRLKERAEVIALRQQAQAKQEKTVKK